MSKLIITKENYHSIESDIATMSRTQYLKFLKCESAAMAYLRGEYEEAETVPFLCGRMLHAWNEGTLEQFKANNPHIVSSKGPTKGELKTDYQCVEKMITALENDPMCMTYLEGEKEKIFIAEFAGCTWRIMVDSYRPRTIVDLKSTKSIRERVWSEERGERVSFIEAYHYPLQFALYGEIERRALGAFDSPEGYMVAVSKENVPDKAVIDMTDPARWQTELEQIEMNMPRILAVKKGEVEPKDCGKCDWCKSTKMVSHVVHYSFV